MNDFTIAGFDELQDDLLRAVKLYPDKAMETLEHEGREFKKRVREITRSVTKEYTGNITKGFRISKAKGFGTEMYVEFSAEGKKNPHFHLVENGHDAYAGGRKGYKGKKVGFVPGKHMVKKATLEYREKLPEALEKMRDEILREVGMM